MIARFRVLREARRITGENRVEFNAADVTRYLQLHALNSMLPSMFHLAQARDASPRTAFLLLSQLAGQLATFAPDGDMTTPLDFDYTNLESSFGAVFDLCERLLAALDTERYVTCRLELQTNGRFYADLSDVRLDGCSRFLIGVDSKHARALGHAQAVGALQVLSAVLALAGVSVLASVVLRSALGRRRTP
jgi:type VI secretion system protein ImpJ